jgi:DNA-binding NtrC family response regulator
LIGAKLEGTAITGQDQGVLLSITELGGYPDFTPIYQRHGFKVETATSVRNATRLMKKITPRVIVAEFNYQSDFRDRTSSLETLMAVLQRMPTTHVIVFYEQEYTHQLERLTSRFPVHAALPFPIDEIALEEALRTIVEG